MAEVVEARLIPRGGVALDRGVATHPDKQLVGLFVAEGMPGAGHKKRRTVSGRDGQAAALVGIRAQCCGEFGPNRHPARFIELGVSHRDEPLVEVHISEGQCEGFADPHRTAIQQEQ